MAVFPAPAEATAEIMRGIGTLTSQIRANTPDPVADPATETEADGLPYVTTPYEKFHGPNQHKTHCRFGHKRDVGPRRAPPV